MNLIPNLTLLSPIYRAAIRTGMLGWWITSLSKDHLLSKVKIKLLSEIVLF